MISAVTSSAPSAAARNLARVEGGLHLGAAGHGHGLKKRIPQGLGIKVFQIRLPEHGHEELLFVLDRRGIKERDVFLGAALPLEVHGHQVGACGHQKPDDAATIFGVAHEAGDHREDAAAHATVAFAVALAEVGVGAHRS